MDSEQDAFDAAMQARLLNLRTGNLNEAQLSRIACGLPANLEPIPSPGSIPPPLEPHIVPHLDRDHGRAEARDLLRVYHRGSAASEELTESYAFLLSSTPTNRLRLRKRN